MLQEHCFWSLRALLSASESYAFGVSEQCFWSLRAMLSASESYAFRVWELCYSILLAYSDWLRLSYYRIPLIFF